jgi:hypothetical protein
VVQNNPELAQAILSDDTEVLQMLLRRQHQHRVELQRRQQQELVSYRIYGKFKVKIPKIWHARWRNVSVKVILT